MKTNIELARLEAEYYDRYDKGNLKEYLELNQQIYEEVFERWKCESNELEKHKLGNKLEKLIMDANFAKRWLAENSHIDITKPPTIEAA